MKMTGLKLSCFCLEVHIYFEIELYRDKKNSAEFYFNEHAKLQIHEIAFNIHK